MKKTFNKTDASTMTLYCQFANYQTPIRTPIHWVAKWAIEDIIISVKSKDFNFYIYKTGKIFSLFDILTTDIFFSFDILTQSNN